MTHYSGFRFPIEISPDVPSAVTKSQLPQNIPFGTFNAPLMMHSSYNDGKWGPLRLEPFAPLEIHPCAKVLHYGQEIFEGLKAFKGPDGSPLLFRPEKNWERFNHSAETLAMAPVEKDFFLGSIHSFTHYCQKFIPSESGAFLYLRPFMLATEAHLSIQPSKEFRYLLVGSPSQAYLQGEIEVMIERSASRAAPGGTGTAKVGGNYAQALKATIESQKRGFGQILWLDAGNKKYVEELSGMNFFAVMGGELHTPKLTDTILSGITRECILTLAQDLQIKIHERNISIDELTKAISSGECEEAFSCGTAAIISPIKSLGEATGERYPLKHKYGPLTKKLRQLLLDIQEGRHLVDHPWSVPVQYS